MAKNVITKLISNITTYVEREFFTHPKYKSSQVWMNRLIDACVDFSGSFSDFKERRRRKLKSTMPSNNDHQGAANNQVSFLRNSSMY